MRARLIFATWAVFLALAATVEWAIFTRRTPNYYLLLVQPAFAIVGTLAIAILAAPRRDQCSGGHPTVVADLSLPSALVGMALGVILWGAFVGEWLLLIGAGLLALGFGGVSREVVSARRLAKAASRLASEEFKS